MTAAVYLMFAIILEVAGTTSMKLSNGFTQLMPSIFIFVFYFFSFGFLTLSLKRLEVSTAYAVWSGLGTLLIAFIGMIFFKEPMTMIKAFSLALIILGVVGLRLG
jgi:small multidrug resistance pump